MKKIFVYTALVILCLGITACGESKDQAVKSAEKSKALEENTQSNSLTAETEEETEIASQILDVNALTTEQAKMLEIMDAINLTMNKYNNVYHPDDEVFLWRSIDLMVQNYGISAENETAGLVSRNETDQLIQASSELVESYAKSIYSGYSSLPSIPEAVNVMEDTKEGFYDFHFPQSRDSESKITGWIAYEDGSNEVQSEMIQKSDQKVLLKADYVLIPNSDYDPQNPKPGVFAYSVESVTLIE